MKPKKIQVKETQRYWGEFTGELENIIVSLQSLLDEGWEGIESDFIPYEDYEGFFVYKHREETDKEYEKRMKILEEQKLKAKEKRRKLFEGLKKEFGEE